MMVYSPYGMAEVMAASSRKRFSAISTFAGGGGSSTGYRLAGGVVLGASEFVPEAARTYRANYPGCPVDTRDIRDVVKTADDVHAFLATHGVKPGELDVLDGSPPCSEFSIAGSGISDQDELKSYSDVKQKNIATLAFDFADFALVARPKVVVMENVPALATRGRVVLDGLMREFGKEYHVNHSVLSAMDFGVPQKRRRLFVVAVRKDVGEKVGIASNEAILGLYPHPRGGGVSIRSAIKDLKHSPAEVWPWRRAVMVSSLGSSIRRLPRDPTKVTLIRDIDPNDTSQFTLKRCAWDLPAPTLVVTGQRPDGMTGCIHPDEDRKFTLRELKRLFALPDDFMLTGTLAQGAERICRMVPPPVIKAIANSIYHRVLKPHKETSK